MPDPLYAIKTWDDLYENADSRRVRYPRWAAVTNRLDGDGYCELVTHHPNGLQHFAVWILLWK